MADLTKAQLQEALDEANARIQQLESQSTDDRILELNAKLSKADSRISSLTEELDEAKDEIIDLGKRAVNSTEIEHLKLQLREANDLISDLNRVNDKLEKQAELGIKLPILTVEGKNYLFTAARFKLPVEGRLVELNAVDVKDDSKEAHAILAINGQGILEEIVLPETEED